MMTHREISLAVLLAFFDLSHAGLPVSVERVAGRLGLGASDVSAALDRLAQRGFVRGRSLTLAGLAIASSLDASRQHESVAFAA